ncbi:serine/threonine-protein phosphatase 6 regulatory subunit 3 [Lepeophtheirus salmonis]|uniref:serine/threonine-protein phosphatase 6 regulatory subunit 3 n=1 Tax=Lepeophtheirus salmonis TaxID=72036 RepID=UPI001AE1A055|nr:serine/threonine-protein phosphatase 6 regulatory subunit 3-like [Lepeophtheirus salmonis]XP_040571819.1 serine/threonine-protein phosphatase 6 regulatory subunit 3-like [Lepeophtheirus salmonis]
MFFRHNTCSHHSQIDVLFEKTDLQLSEVLEHVEVIQEVKNRNKHLLKYLMTNEVLSELIGIIITEPSEELSDDVRFKLPHIASELLNCDIPEINDMLSSNTALLEHLYSFIEQDSPLNPLLSSFFSKAFGVLMKRSNGQNWYEYQVSSIKFYHFLKEKNFINHLLKHIGTSAISDLVIKLITSAEEGVKINILQWLDEQNLVGSIIDLLDPANDLDTHENACYLLIEILEASKENQSKQTTIDPILATLESSYTVDSLLKRILGSEKCESIIINGVSVFLALLDSPYGDYKTSKEVRETIIEALVPAIPSFTSLLLDPPSKPTLRTTAGVLETPLGATRLSVAKLIAALLTSSNMNVNLELTKNKTLDILLDLFFKYSLNNFLHYQVVTCILNVFNWNVEDKASKVFDLFSSHANMMFNSFEEKETLPGTDVEEDEVTDNPLLVHLYTDCRLVERVLGAWVENNSKERQSGFHRKGYMAHLTKIANVMHEFANKGGSKKLIQEQIEKLPPSTLSDWETFVNGDLVDINEKNSTNLQRSFFADMNDQRPFENETMFKNIINLDAGTDDNNPAINIIKVPEVKSVDCVAWIGEDNFIVKNFDYDNENDEGNLKEYDNEDDNDWIDVDNQIAIDGGNPWENAENEVGDHIRVNTELWASFDTFDEPSNTRDIFSNNFEIEAGDVEPNVGDHHTESKEKEDEKHKNVEVVEESTKVVESLDPSSEIKEKEEEVTSKEKDLKAKEES